VRSINPREWESLMTDDSAFLAATLPVLAAAGQLKSLDRAG